MDLNDVLDDELNDRERELEIENSTSKLVKEARIERSFIESSKYGNIFRDFREDIQITRKMLSSAREMLKHHDGDRFEDLYFIDSITGNISSRTDYREKEHTVTPTKAMIQMLKNKNRIIAIHNHPTNGIPSPDDFYACYERKYKYGVVVCHNGSVYQYSVCGDLLRPNIESAFDIYEKSEYESLRSFPKDEILYEMHIEHITDFINGLKMAGILLKEIYHYERAN